MLAGQGGAGRIRAGLTFGVHAPHGSIGIDDHGADGGDRARAGGGGGALLEREGRHAAVPRVPRRGGVRASRGDRGRQRLGRRQSRAVEAAFPCRGRDPDGDERRVLRRCQRRHRSGDREGCRRGAAPQQRHGGRAGISGATRPGGLRARGGSGVQPDPVRRPARPRLVRGRPVPAAARASRP